MMTGRISVPQFPATYAGVPGRCAVWVNVKGAPAALPTNNQPAEARSRVPKQGEQIDFTHLVSYSAISILAAATCIITHMMSIVSVML